MPPVENRLDLLPIGEVLHVKQHVAEEDNVIERDGHTAARERMPHVPRVTEKQHALLRLLALL